MVKVGVCLSGCGVNDGAEIHESVITLLALDRAGAKIVCIAPAGAQRQVVNHATGKQSEETRDILVESARIARGNIQDIKNITAQDLDALIFPGGFGMPPGYTTIIPLDRIGRTFASIDELPEPKFPD